MNIFKVKRGKGAPPKGTLEEGELGYSIDQKTIYIGDKNKEAVPVNISVTFRKWESTD